MTAVIQRVKNAEVRVSNEIIGSCGDGLFILLGVISGDNEEDAELLARKIARLRIFTDENEKMNLSVCDIGGSVLVVSNFTLAADYKKGNRPDYFRAAHPSEAEKLYERFIELLSAETGSEIGHGRFGADMSIDACCDGPVTIVMDSMVLKGKGK